MYAKRANCWGQYRPDYAVPPGRSLQETREYLGLSMRDLAFRLKVSERCLRQFVAGKKRLTTTLAARLERATGVPAEIWKSLEATYRQQLARLGKAPPSGKQKNETHRPRP